MTNGAHAPEQPPSAARVGDWLEVHGPRGKPPQRGQVTEVLGAGGHLRYRVRWDEKHESVYYPPAGVAIVRLARRAGAPPRRATSPKRS